MNNGKTWGEVFKDHAFLFSLYLTTQFFVLILVFNIYSPSKMDPEAKMIILQTYVVAFTASWGYYLGSSASSKAKDEKLMPTPQQAAQP